MTKKLTALLKQQSQINSETIKLSSDIWVDRLKDVIEVPIEIVKITTIRIAIVLFSEILDLPILDLQVCVSFFLFKEKKRVFKPKTSASTLFRFISWLLLVSNH